MHRVSIILALVLFSAPAWAQLSIYTAPENLHVLDGDISPEELQATMKSFAIGTGLRCSECHIGEEGQQLSDYDFASDDKALKVTARKMLEMTNDINSTYLATAGGGGVQVTCETCHRGVRLPKFTGELLAEAAQATGSQGIRDEWTRLRAEYYGTHSYDFSEWTLTEFARQRFGAGKPDEAAATLDILLEQNPDSFQGHFMYGELLARNGDADGAREHYAKALELNADAAPWIEPRLEQLQSAE